MGDAKKKPQGQFTHWARPRWIRMYEYNYQFGESYYSPQIRYVSTSKAMSSSSASYSSSTTSAETQSRLASYYRKRAGSPPKAASFIERWSAEPFYGLYGYGTRRSSSASRAESRESQIMSLRAESVSRESQMRSTSRAESVSRAQSISREQQQHLEYERSSSRAQSEMRSRRDQSEVRRSDHSNYASDSLLNQINNVRASSVALQEESAQVQDRLRSRRARSLEARMRAERELSYDNYYGYASDDQLMRSNALQQQQLQDDNVRRSRREQSVLQDIESRYSREVNQNSGFSSDIANFEYPRQHLVCTENCPLYTDPEHHRRFLIGQRYGDAAALGGFDVLYDPTVYKKTRNLLSRLSEERDVDTLVYESARESSVDRNRSRSRYSYNTIY